MKISTVDRVKRLHDLVAKAEDGLAVTDGSGRLIYGNQALAEMHGFPPLAYVGDAFASRADDEQLRFLEAAGKLLARPGGLDDEIFCEHRSGGRFKARVARLNLDDAQGNLIGVVFLFRRSALSPASAKDKKSASRAHRAHRHPQPHRRPEVAHSDMQSNKAQDPGGPSADRR